MDSQRDTFLKQCLIFIRSSESVGNGANAGVHGGMMAGRTLNGVRLIQLRILIKTHTHASLSFLFHSSISQRSRLRAFLNPRRRDGRYEG